jgi:hypothetical protein
MGSFLLFLSVFVWLTNCITGLKPVVVHNGAHTPDMVGGGEAQHVELLAVLLQTGRQAALALNKYRTNIYTSTWLNLKDLNEVTRSIIWSKSHILLPENHPPPTPRWDAEIYGLLMHSFILLKTNLFFPRLRLPLKQLLKFTWSVQKLLTKISSRVFLRQRYSKAVRVYSRYILETFLAFHILLHSWPVGVQLLLVVLKY